MVERIPHPNLCILTMGTDGMYRSGTDSLCSQQFFKVIREQLVCSDTDKVLDRLVQFYPNKHLDSSCTP